MGHQGDRARLAALADAVQGIGDRGGLEPEPVHSGVDLEPQIERLGKLFELEHAQLLRAVDRASKADGGCLAEIDGREETLQQQHRQVPSGFAQPHRPVHLEGGEAVRAGQRRHHAIEAVTVGVRLHHREHARVARGLLRDRVVVADGFRMDRGEDRAGHV
jgi:hypothetical protein